MEEIITDYSFLSTIRSFTTYEEIVKLLVKEMETIHDSKSEEEYQSIVKNEFSSLFPLNNFNIPYLSDTGLLDKFDNSLHVKTASALNDIVISMVNFYNKMTKDKKQQQENNNESEKNMDLQDSLILYTHTGCMNVNMFLLLFSCLLHIPDHIKYIDLYIKTDKDLLKNKLFILSIDEQRCKCLESLPSVMNKSNVSIRFHHNAKIDQLPKNGIKLCWLESCFNRVMNDLNFVFSNKNDSDIFLGVRSYSEIYKKNNQFFDSVFRLHLGKDIDEYYSKKWEGLISPSAHYDFIKKPLIQHSWILESHHIKPYKNNILYEAMGTMPLIVASEESLPTLIFSLTSDLNKYYNKIRKSIISLLIMKTYKTNSNDDDDGDDNNSDKGENDGSKDDDNDADDDADDDADNSSKKE